MQKAHSRTSVWFVCSGRETWRCNMVDCVEEDPCSKHNNSFHFHVNGLIDFNEYNVPVLPRDPHKNLDTGPCSCRSGIFLLNLAFQAHSLFIPRVPAVLDVKLRYVAFFSSDSSYTSYRITLCCFGFTFGSRLVSNSFSSAHSSVCSFSLNATLTHLKLNSSKISHDKLRFLRFLL